MIQVRRARLAAVTLLLGLAIAGCGKKGDPQAPLRREPGPIADLQALRVDERIELRFTVPVTNADGSRPPVIERIEIYRASTAPDAPAPSITQILQAEQLRATYTIRTDEPPPKTPAPSAPRVAALGETVTFVDGVDPAVKPDTPEAPVWRYIVVGAHGRRRGPPSAVAAVPLAQIVPAAPQPSVAFDERTLTISWPAPPEPAGRVFRVYQVESAAKTAVGKLVSDAKLDKPEFSTAVEFGSERCFVVRMAIGLENTTIEGPPGPAACITPADKFPPAAPGGLIAAPEPGTINLIWNAVDAPDLRGYIVLRGEGAGETLQPLVTEPLTTPTYSDKGLTSGTSYTYAVVAVDRAGNQSAPSERKTVEVRDWRTTGALSIVEGRRTKSPG